MLKVSIMGATGYTGFELVKLLLGNPDVELHCLTSESSPGEAYSALYPALTGLCDKKLSPNDIDLAAESDAVFLCLPHGASMNAAAGLAARKIPVFDLSADYRISDQALYEEVYKTSHKHPELLSEAVYGLAEIYEEQIRTAGLVAVPGCYPTSVLIPLIPLIREKLIDTGHIIADCKSGVSGAGKKPTPTTHFCEANEDFKPYGIFSHRHKPEIDHIIKRAANVDTDVVFTPHLLPMNRGMLSTIYTRSEHTEDELYAAWERAYAGRPFVRIRRGSVHPSVKYVANTPFIDIALYKNSHNLIIVSALDNLLKGASSQAVQCFGIRMDV